MDLNTNILRLFEKGEEIPENYIRFEGRFNDLAMKTLNGRKQMKVTAEHKVLSRWAKRKRMKQKRQKAIVDKCNKYYEKLRKELTL